MFRTAIPVFHVTSAAAAEEFYCGRLGFRRELSGRLAIAVLPWLLAATPAAPPVTTVSPGGVLAAFPEVPDLSLRYAIYLHGRIIEEQGRRAVSPEYGAYEYDDILRALASPAVAVIGELRQKGADPKASAQHVVQEMTRLIDAGVPAGNITVVGASKGALIAMLVSTALPNGDVGYVLMSGCNEGVTQNFEVALHGRVLSIFESSDEMAGTCSPIFEHSPALGRHAEVRLDTGLKHGYLYRPLEEWLEPAVAWIEAGSVEP